MLRSDDTTEHLMVAVLQLLAPLDVFPDPLRTARVLPLLVGGPRRSGEVFKVCELLRLLRVDPLEIVCCRGLPGDAGAVDPFAALRAMGERGGPWLGWLALRGWMGRRPHFLKAFRARRSRRNVRG